MKTQGNRLVSQRARTSGEAYNDEISGQALSMRLITN